MKNAPTEYVSTLFENWSQEAVTGISPLPPSGSDRQYYRISGRKTTAIGAHNPDKKENIAFVKFSRHFHQKGLPVPEIYAEELDDDVYLLQDLGDTTLFGYLSQARSGKEFPDELLTLYRRVLEQLPRFQVVAGVDLNYSVCYPRARFDKQSMLWDLNYFKYYFLKLAKIPFDEQLLEDDFQRFTDYLLETNCEYFLYRDFQSRNVMIHQGEPHFIDYQGGRKGALQYDVASLLYDAKADIPQTVRTELLQHYIEQLQHFTSIDEREFTDYYYGYVLIRLMQAMGAYGFRGFYEKKAHFLQSVPYALENLAWLLENVNLPVTIPALLRVLHLLADSDDLKRLGNHPPLQVRINSFSYKRGIPVDESGHGGGYVFDCRALPNPGRYPEYQDVTGKDAVVVKFFEKEPEVARFLETIYQLVDQSVKNYQFRTFTNLMVSFGCTGGQHRSVYCAEQLAKHLRETFDVTVTLRHIEQEMK
jgi:aminoglycoside/choline kinase family phosphotransferase